MDEKTITKAAYRLRNGLAEFLPNDGFPSLQECQASIDDPNIDTSCCEGDDDLIPFLEFYENGQMQLTVNNLEGDELEVFDLVEFDGELVIDE